LPKELMHMAASENEMRRDKEVSYEKKKFLSETKRNE